jgi:hypothetical protein
VVPPLAIALVVPCCAEALVEEPVAVEPVPESLCCVWLVVEVSGCVVEALVEDPVAVSICVVEALVEELVVVEVSGCVVEVVSYTLWQQDCSDVVGVLL